MGGNTPAFFYIFVASAYWLVIVPISQTPKIQL